MKNIVFTCAEKNSYSDWQDHSEEIDQLLGFNIVQIENDLLDQSKKNTYSDVEAWIGLHHRQLQTPYPELSQMISQLHLQENEHLVDLGAGYGRLGVILNQDNSQNQFTGIECVKERVDEGNRIYKKYNCENARLIHDDLSSENFILPIADIYFIYDYGRLEHIKKTMNQISQVADSKNIKVIARGRGCRTYINHHHPWLSDVCEPIHEESYSIYQSLK